MDIKIAPALRSEFPGILQKAKALDLDCENASVDEFSVVKRGDEVIAFGRLKKNEQCLEASTIGVVKEEQGKGMGSLIVNELLNRAGEDTYLITVIPAFFSRFGFMEVDEFPQELLKKCEFCHSFGYKKGEVFVMKKILKRN